MSKKQQLKKAKREQTWKIRSLIDTLKYVHNQSLIECFEFFKNGKSIGKIICDFTQISCIIKDNTNLFAIKI